MYSDATLKILEIGLVYSSEDLTNNFSSFSFTPIRTLDSP